MSSNQEDIKYSLTVEEYNGRVNTYTCDTEEELFEAMEKHKNKVITIKKVMNDILN